jgi:hypothetical protein
MIFKAVFWFAIQKMKESNIQFSSPGNSYGRKYCYWFNSHFWEEDFNPPAFAKQEFLFNESLKILEKHIHILFPFQNDQAGNEIESAVVIKEGNELSELGKEFLHSIPPF